MIHRLRRRHRLTWIALAVLFPPAFAVALAWRPAPPPSAAIPAALDAEPAGGAPRWERDDLWSALPVRTRLFEASAAPGPLLELEPLRAPMKPDLLVYWATEGPAERLPDGAHLVGRLAGAEARRFPLPPAARERPGRLYLYSLGHGELVDSAALPSAAR